MVDSYLSKMGSVINNGVMGANGTAQGHGRYNNLEGSGTKGMQPWDHQRRPSTEGGAGTAIMCSTHSDTVTVVTQHPGGGELRHVRREGGVSGGGGIRAIVGVSGLPGLSLTTWEEFLENPAVLHPLFQTSNEEVIVFDPEEVNVFFQDSRLIGSSVGAPSTDGKGWRIPVEDYEQLRQVRSWLTERVSVLSVCLVSKRLSSSPESAAACLLVLNPACSSIRERLYSVLSDAMSSFLRHRHFCVEVDLSSCLETWCQQTLRLRCRAEGARLVVTNGDEYHHRSEEKNMVCRVACFPFWLVQRALYKVRRRSEYDDHFVSFEDESLVLCTQSGRLRTYAEQYKAYKKNASPRTQRVMKWIKKNKKSVTTATQTSTTSLQSATYDLDDGTVCNEGRDAALGDEDEEDEELARLEEEVMERRSRRSGEIEAWELQRKLALKKATASVVTLRGDTSILGDYPDHDYNFHPSSGSPDATSPSTVKGLVIPADSDRRPDSPVPPRRDHQVSVVKSEVVATMTTPSPRLSDDQQGTPRIARHPKTVPRLDMTRLSEVGGVDNAGFLNDEGLHQGTQDSGSDLVKTQEEAPTQQLSPRGKPVLTQAGIAAGADSGKHADRLLYSSERAARTAAAPATASDMHSDVISADVQGKVVTSEGQSSAELQRQSLSSSSSQLSSPTSPQPPGGVLPKAGSVSRSKLPPPPPPPPPPHVKEPTSPSVRVVAVYPREGPSQVNVAEMAAASLEMPTSLSYKPTLAPQPAVTSLWELCQSPPPVNLPPEASRPLVMKKPAPVTTGQQIEEAPKEPPVPRPRSSLMKTNEEVLPESNLHTRSQSIPKTRQRSPERRSSEPVRERGAAQGARLREDTPTGGTLPPERRQRPGSQQPPQHADVEGEGRALRDRRLDLSELDLEPTPESLKIDLSIFSSDSPRRPPPVMPRKLAPPPNPAHKSILRNKMPVLEPGQPLRAVQQQQQQQQQQKQQHKFQRPPGPKMAQTRGPKLQLMPLVTRPTKGMPDSRDKGTSESPAEGVEKASWRYDQRKKRFGRLLSELLDNEDSANDAMTLTGGNSRLTAAALKKLRHGRRAQYQNRDLRSFAEGLPSDDDNNDEEVMDAVNRNRLDRSSVMGFRGSSSASPADSEELFPDAPNGFDLELCVNTARRGTAGWQTPGGTWHPPDLSCANVNSFVRAGTVSRASIRETAEVMLFTPRYKLVEELEEGRNCFSDPEVDDTLEVEAADNDVISDTDTLPTPRIISVKRTPQTFAMDFVAKQPNNNDLENEADLELSDCEDNPATRNAVLPGVKAARLLSAGQRKRRPSRGQYDSRRRYLALNSLRRKTKSMALQSEIRKTAIRVGSHPMSVTM